MPQHIHSPNLIGLTQLSLLARLLDGEESRVVFRDAEQAIQPVSSPDGKIVGICINDGPANDRPMCCRMFFTEWPISQQLSPGVVLQRSNGNWLVIPSLFGDVECMNAPAFVVRENWVTAAYLLAKEEVVRLIPFTLDPSKVSHAQITQEIRAQCVSCATWSPFWFFTAPERFLEWMVATSWEEHTRLRLTVANRVRELNRCDEKLKLTAAAYRKCCMKLGLPTLPPSNAQAVDEPVAHSITRQFRKERELMSPLRIRPDSKWFGLSEFTTDDQRETIGVEAAYPEEAKAITLNEKELMLVRDWNSDGDAEFSYGGSHDLVLATDSAIADHFPTRVEGILDLVERVWWWKTAMDDFKEMTTAMCLGETEKESVKNLVVPPWPEEAYGRFRDNWERSAFFYEFRARYKERYSWGFFGKPWVKLRVAECGILRCIWPPTHVGKWRLEPKLHPLVLKQMKLKAQMAVTVDQRLPPEKIKELVQEELERLLKAKGLALSGRGSGRPRMRPWRALQYMDVDHYLGRKFPDNETKLNEIERDYEEACAKAGIEP